MKTVQYAQNEKICKKLLTNRNSGAIIKAQPSDTA